MTECWPPPAPMGPLCCGKKPRAAVFSACRPCQGKFGRCGSPPMAAPCSGPMPARPCIAGTSFMAGNCPISRAMARRVTALAFSADGRLLASGSRDTTVLLWDLKATAPRPKRIPSDLPAPDRLWAALAGDDTAQTYGAIWELTARPAKAVSFFKTRMPLNPRQAENHRRAHRGTGRQGFPRFARKATETLGKRGELARSELLRTLQGKPSLEKRTRLEANPAAARPAEGPSVAQRPAPGPCRASAGMAGHGRITRVSSGPGQGPAAPCGKPWRRRPPCKG